MKISNLLTFNKDIFFDGAVQADWFYDQEKSTIVSNSYVFHGPKYFGVNERDINQSKHKLVDTVSFVENITNKLYSDDLSSRFMLTIAGYGTGKSHLAVTMASLFSGHDKNLRTSILNKIKSVDDIIGSSLEKTIKGSNLILVLNGMKNFNLNFEVLKCAKNILKMNGLDESILEDMTKAYKTAVHFVENTYETFNEKYFFYAKNKSKYSVADKGLLKELLIKNIDQDINAFEIINNVYKDINGNYIRWDEGITAGDILAKLNKVFCEDKKIFNKIILIFDEFGRFIEYASSHPSIAGESALQQIFEAIQNANKNILFVGFIQSDLNAYLARIEKTSNIIRYVGRYEASDKYYLSSNFETILANLITKKDHQTYSRIVEFAIENTYKNYHNNLFYNIQRWLKQANQRSVWTNNELYNQVILKGTYPIHPITIWMLSNLSSWMQQRSSLTFVEEVFEIISEQMVVPGEMNYVYPIEIIESKIFDELIIAEENGLQSSQNCLLFQDIKNKYGDKLSTNTLKTLQGILIINLGKFSILNKEDIVTALKYCTGLSKEIIPKYIHVLEAELGVIEYDQQLNRYDFIAEGNGLNEFKREFLKKKLRIVKEGIIDSCDEEIIRELTINSNIETQFGIEKKICSQEWQFTKRLIDIRNFTEQYVNGLLADINKSYDSEKPRGIVQWVYCNSQTYEYIEQFIQVIKNKKIDSYPILCLLINDVERLIEEGLIDRVALKSFLSSERTRFEKFIIALNKSALKKVVSTFNELAAQRYIITAMGVVKYDQRLNILCNQLFGNLFTKSTPFLFDGFEKKNNSNAKKYLYTICSRLLDGSITNHQAFYGLGTDIQNRIKSVLGVNGNHSWKVITDECILCEPQNMEIKQIFDDVINELENCNGRKGTLLFNKYLLQPYGFNIYSLSMFVSYIIAFKSRNINVFLENKRIKNVELASLIFNDKKPDLEMLLKLEYRHFEGDITGKVMELCNGIMINTYVEKCDEYKNSFEVLLDEEEVPKELEPRVAAAKIKLNEGLRLNQKIYLELNEAKQILNNSVLQKFNLSKAVKLYNIVKMETGSIEKGSEYRYSESYIEECKRILQILDEGIDENAEKYVKSMTCQITEFSQFRNVYKKVVEILNDNGKQELAILVMQRIEEIRKEMDFKNKYEKVVAQFEQEISFMNDLNFKRYNELKNALNKLQKWEAFFRDAVGLSQITKNGFFKKISCVKENLESNIEKVDQEILATINKCQKIDNLNDMKGLRCEIIQLVNRDLPSEVTDELQKNLDLIREFENLHEQIIVTKLENQEIKQKTSLLRDRFKKTFLEDFSEQTSDKILEDLIGLEYQWLNDFVDSIQNKIDEMTINECLKWRDRTDSLPRYLSEKSLLKYAIVSKMVDMRIQSCKIEGIITMFEQLNLEERKRCIEMLLKTVNTFVEP